MDLKEFFNKYKIHIIVFFVLLMFGLLLSNREKEGLNLITVGTSSTSIVGENYQTIISRLETRGFTNIEVVLIEDLVLGWFVKDGEIESVEIDGITNFSSSSSFSKEAKIIITYHTFPNKNPNDEKPVIVVNHTQEMAIRAIIVAFTNRFSDDVFASDGSGYDKSKFHSFDNISKLVVYLDKNGKWIPIDERTWRVEDLRLKSETNLNQSDIVVNANISFDGTNYFITNLSGKAPSFSDISVFKDNSNYSTIFTVSKNLIVRERAQIIHLKEDVAKDAFRSYGTVLNIQGFETHWFTGTEKSTRYYDGSWFFRVKVTITNVDGTKRKTVAEAYVNNKTQAVEKFRIE